MPQLGAKNNIDYNFIGVRLKEKDGMALDNSGISILNLRLKTILDTLKDVEEVWYVIDLSAFSSKKKFFDYQESALRNAIKGLYYFYGKYRGSKEEFLRIFIEISYLKVFL
jgi:hypothetical protein